MRASLLPASGLALALTACASPRAPAPSPVPPPVQRPAPPAGPVVTGERAPASWDVADLSPGEWRLREDAGAGSAQFGVPGQRAEAALSCSRGQLTLVRLAPNLSVGARHHLRVRTSYGEHHLPATHDTAGTPTLSATVGARSPMWDEVSYSRGRFVVEGSGVAPLIIPVRSELIHLLERCRT